MVAKKTVKAPANSTGILEVRGLRKAYKTRGSLVTVLNGVDFTVGDNETVGLVGSSGAGKSTIGRIIAGLEQADSGSMDYLGQELQAMKPNERRLAAKSIQMIFQDPYESLSPRMTIEQLVSEPLIIQKQGKDRSMRRQLVLEALEEVSLTPPERFIDRYPHELSGGERQRVGLARAFICRPRLIVADEPTSMLDASLRLELLQAMAQLRERHRISYLFITHDIALTRNFCDRLLVLDKGEIVEAGNSGTVIDHPQHQFTRSLIQALMDLNRI
ncbi:ABC transporter ATP-binding protein [Paenibacillus radicis (ex Xue et al. 2023)]|uniref:Dipeptide/oligopeptide/nickel ABC transporter ATP-binding protein n=1 Tax=Paenibacillus radicis (ex Xue et al. 2023) TaxID=2972489 RepID=A0ABT1YEP9_9BACL|nr:dipeptide/oligopeptide/nickel ABC transporter ATP-binding protein [Paenibacillus radicis (ex Xue et al. 2023)]MCR8631675.1 dipeptide/oligopeptide/nickel ABC transporter ATP-binding protein [Paenibacillus radicis (ex Xue et al. 2023)]